MSHAIKLERFLIDLRRIIINALLGQKHDLAHSTPKYLTSMDNASDSSYFIHLQIDDIRIKVKANPQTEETIRKAAIQVDRTLKMYKQYYTDCPPEQLLACVAIGEAYKKIELEEKENQHEDSGNH